MSTSISATPLPLLCLMHCLLVSWPPRRGRRALPLGVRTLVWWDPDAPVAAGMLVAAARTSGAAVYACAEGRCSSPATTVSAVEDLAEFFRATDPVAESDEAVPR